jgi:MFS family permease
MHLVVSLSLLLGFGLGFAQPVVMTLIYLNSPLGRTGEVIGIRTTLLNASQTILPWSAGIVGTGIGIASIFCVAAPAIGFGAWYANEYGKRSTQNARNK